MKIEKWERKKKKRDKKFRTRKSMAGISIPKRSHVELIKRNFRILNTYVSPSLFNAWRSSDDRSLNSFFRSITSSTCRFLFLRLSRTMNFYAAKRTRLSSLLDSLEPSKLSLIVQRKDIIIITYTILYIDYYYYYYYIILYYINIIIIIIVFNTIVTIIQLLYQRHRHRF